MDAKFFNGQRIGTQRGQRQRHRAMTEQEDEMSMAEEEEEYYSDEDYPPGTPGSFDARNGTTIQHDGLPRVQHHSSGWNVSLPIMVETKYCGCYSWLVGLLMLPCFGGFVCCCPIDKHMRPKKYEDRSCCDSLCDFCFPSRRRDMLINLEYRRNKKWIKVRSMWHTGVPVKIF